MVKALKCLAWNEETQRRNLNAFIQDAEGNGEV